MLKQLNRAEEKRIMETSCAQPVFKSSSHQRKLLLSNDVRGLTELKYRLPSDSPLFSGHFTKSSNVTYMSGFR